MVRFFDNLVVNLRHGPLVEQTDYYAFGMAIPGLSTSAYKYQYNQNRYKYNGIELDTALGLDYYEAHFRDLDPETCRWTTIDPSPDESESPYASMGNNPVSRMDLLGDSAVPYKSVTLGASGININNKGYRNQLKAVQIANSKNSKNAPPLVGMTLALTKGTYGSHGSTFGITSGQSASINEKDIIGVRDNKIVNGSSTYKNGISVAIEGAGGEVSVESKKPMANNGDLPNQYESTQKMTAPGMSYVVQKDQTGKQTYTGMESEVFSFKIGFNIGIDLSLKISMPLNGTVSAPSNGSFQISDNTRVAKDIPEIKTLQ